MYQAARHVLSSYLRCSSSVQRVHVDVVAAVACRVVDWQSDVGAIRLAWWSVFDTSEKNHPTSLPDDDFQWEDEFSGLRSSSGDELRKYMGDERSLLQAYMSKLRGADGRPLHETMSHELVERRQAFASDQAGNHEQLGNASFSVHTDESGAQHFVREVWNETSRTSNRMTLLSSTEECMAGRFDRVSGVKLSQQQTALAVLIADSDVPEANNLLIKSFPAQSPPQSSTTAPPSPAPAPMAPGMQPVTEEIPAVHSAEWMLDGRHVVYSRVDERGAPREVWLHEVGTDVGEDRMLYEEEGEGFFVHVNRTKDWRFITISCVSKTSTEVHVLDASDSGGAPELLEHRQPGLLYWVSSAHGRLVIMHNARTGLDYDVAVAPALELLSPPGGGSGLLSVMKDALFRPPEAAADGVGMHTWQELVLAEGGVIEDIDVRSEALVLFTREGGLPAIRVAALDRLGVTAETAALQPSQQTHHSVRLLDLPRLELPSWAMAVTPASNLDFESPLLTVYASSPTHPEASLTFDLSRGNTAAVSRDLPGVAAEDGSVEAALHAELSQYTVTRVQVPVMLEPSMADVNQLLERLPVTASAPAPADTPLPEGSLALDISLIHSQSNTPPTDSPVVVRAYGAYGLCADLSFDPDDLSLLSRGVVIAVLHIRGGGERGRAWHRAGAGENKWASMYDYAAGLHFLLRRQIARPGALAIDSFSAGSLVASHALSRRPDVFAAALLRRPFVALFETMADPSLPLTVHEYEEWGGSDYVASLKMWREMCPHLNIAAARYPPVLITVGQQDSRVEWWGPVKYGWRLRQHQLALEKPILLQWGGGGHFGDDVAEKAMQTAFLLAALFPSQPCQ